MEDWDFYHVHEIGPLGRTLSKKKYRIRKVRPTGGRLDEWFWERDSN